MIVKKRVLEKCATLGYMSPSPAEMNRTDLEVYPKLLQTLLLNRGLVSKKEIEEFLHPNYERDIRDPFGILNMERAVDRILEGIYENQKIVIYGDYDCDGIPGSVVLHDFFKKIAYPSFSNYIPHRHLEGYGLNAAAVEQFAPGITIPYEPAAGSKLATECKSVIFLVHKEFELKVRSHFFLFFK